MADKFTRSKTSENEREERKTLQDHAPGVSKRLDAVPGATIEDMGKHLDIQLIPEDNRDSMIAALRADEAKKYQFAIPGRPETESGKVAVSPETLTPAPEAAPHAPEKALNARQKTILFLMLKARINEDEKRYKDIQWPKVKSALEAANGRLLYGLFQMEENGHQIGVKSEERDCRRGLRFDSCSKESPIGQRDIDYFRAEAIAEKDWGIPLVPPKVFEELRAAGIINNISSWDHLKTPNPGTPAKPSGAFYGDFNGIGGYDAAGHDHLGVFRCSLWVPEA